MSDAKGHSPIDHSAARTGGSWSTCRSTRPQRSSPRRAAARKAAQAARAGAGAPARGTSRPQGARNKPAADALARRARAPARKRPARAQSAGASPKRGVAPRQGFESDSESHERLGQPPGGAELVASAAEIVGELAKAGLSSGERLLKDVLSRLPRS